MDALTEFAKLFRERDNRTVQGVGIGEVAGVSPLKVLFNGFVLEDDWLVASAHLLAAKTSSGATVADHGSHSHTVDYTVKAGDKVIVVPSADNMKYYIVGKVG